MAIAQNLTALGSPEAIEKLSTQQKRAIAWEIIDEYAPSKGFSRKKLVPLHSAIMSILSSPESCENLIGNIEKVLTEPQPPRR